MTARARVFVIGDRHWCEFAEACAWLVQQASVSFFSNCQAVEKYLGDSLDDHGAELPQVILLCQSHPGQFHVDAIEAIHRRAPVARLVSLLGSLCEGESRSGKPWPGVSRVYWFDWQPRFEREFGRSTKKNASVWELPRTASDVDTALHLSHAARRLDAATKSQRHEKGSVAVRSRSASARLTLMDACETLGFSVEPLDDLASLSVRSTGAVLWDCDSLNDAECAELVAVRQRVGEIPVIVVAGFPRAQDQQLARTIGVAAIVSKPFVMDDLCWHLDVLMTPKTLLRKLA
jgi:hypothetical protein